MNYIRNPDFPEIMECVIFTTIVWKRKIFRNEKNLCEIFNFSPVEIKTTESYKLLYSYVRVKKKYKSHKRHCLTNQMHFSNEFECKWAIARDPASSNSPAAKAQRISRKTHLKCDEFVQ